MSDEKPAFQPRYPGDKGEDAPAPSAVEAFYAGHRMRIERRKDREAKAKKIFGRQNVGHTAPR